MKTIRFLIPWFLITVGCFVFATEGNHDRFSPEAEADAAALRESISIEIQLLEEHPWAGEYYWGDLLGTNVTLLLAPESGYLYERITVNKILIPVSFSYFKIEKQGA